MHRDNWKDAFQPSQELTRPHPLHAQGYRGLALLKDFCFEKRAPESPHSQGCLGVFLHVAHRHSEATAAMVPGGLATTPACGRPCCSPLSAGFAGIQMQALGGMETSRKVWEARQCNSVEIPPNIPYEGDR